MSYFLHIKLQQVIMKQNVFFVSFQYNKILSLIFKISKGQNTTLTQSSIQLSYCYLQYSSLSSFWGWNVWTRTWKCAHWLKILQRPIRVSDTLERRLRQMLHVSGSERCVLRESVKEAGNLLGLLIEGVFSGRKEVRGRAGEGAVNFVVSGESSWADFVGAREQELYHRALPAFCAPPMSLLLVVDSPRRLV